MNEAQTTTQDSARIGAVVILDALGASTLSISGCLRFLKQRDLLLQELEGRQKVLTGLGEHIGVQLGAAEVLTFGDTIVLAWDTSKLEPDRYLPTLAHVLVEIFLTALFHGILLRGAVSVGQYIVQKGTVLGPAVADAAFWYEKADWAGIIATPTCGLHVSTLFERLAFEGNSGYMNEWFVKYLVPLKGERTTELWAIAWPHRLCSKHAQEVVKNIVEEARRGQKPEAREFSSAMVFWRAMSTFRVPAGTESKYSNTIKFFQYFRDQLPCKKKENGTG